MLIIGLTGGIGAGKSVVSNLFAQLGVPVIDADVIARQVTAPGQPSLTKIREHFGADFLHSDGSLDRKKLRSIIFTDPKERHWLEKLLHPLIRQEIDHQVAALQSDYCLVVIPLLHDLTAFPNINRVLLIDTTEALQFERVKQRDQIEEVEIKAILNAQTSRQARLLQAQDVIFNDGILEDLIPQVQKLHQFYLQLASKFKTS